MGDNMNNYNINPFEKFNKEWALVTAGTKDKFNSMTISWGSMGTLWFKDIITIYIRPSRYTFEFLNNNDTFTISFYDEKYKNALGVFGKYSGRDTNKLELTKFNPKILEDGITYEEAYETIVLKKIYVQQLDSNCFVNSDDNTYNNDEHYMIIGEVIRRI